MNQVVMANEGRKMMGSGNGSYSKKNNGDESKQENGRKPSFADLLDNYAYAPPRQGDVLNALVLRVAPDVIFMDVGAKRDAIVPTYEIEDLDEPWLNSLSPGDEVPVFIQRTPLGGESLQVSVRKGLEAQDWLRAQEYLDSGETLELEIVGFNKGGMLVEFGRIRGFVPNSHMPGLRHSRQKVERQSWKQQTTGETRGFKVIEVNRERQRLVLSARDAVKEMRLKELMSLSEGDRVTGVVEHLVKYGAFVRLNYVTGLLHISRISWQNVDHPSDVLSPGDEIEVLVDNIDIAKEQISLNRRALLPSPWEEFADKHEIGDLKEGVVTSVLDFGAFIQLENGIEGLAHVSEIDIAHGSDPAAVLQTGDMVLTRIISIEPDRQRLGLSLRRVSAQEQIEWIQQQKPVETALAADEAVGTEDAVGTEEPVDIDEAVEIDETVDSETAVAETA